MEKKTKARQPSSAEEVFDSENSKSCQRDFENSDDELEHLRSQFNRLNSRLEAISNKQSMTNIIKRPTTLSPKKDESEVKKLFLDKSVPLTSVSTTYPPSPPSLKKKFSLSKYLPNFTRKKTQPQPDNSLSSRSRKQNQNALK